MKVLILYGTKTGTTGRCAEKIRQQLPDTVRQSTDLVDIRQLNRRQLTDYDTFVIGTPIYMGRIQRRIRYFFWRYRKLLLEKQVHIFICSLAPGAEGVALFRQKADATLFAHAKQVSQLGCEIHPAQINVFYRFIIQKLIENDQPEIGLRDDDIAAFARKIAPES